MGEITIDVKSIPPPVIAAHCRTLLNCIGDYFDNPTHQKEFEAWHMLKYGTPPARASYINNDIASGECGGTT